ncbi:MAG: branched-chain amino acid transferase [Chromatiales bacterium]|jgi:branched-chain amino acid aminotransferase|nr:branched-chain amino acid transferase [Chromatiales bacterium]
MSSDNTTHDWSRSGVGFIDGEYCALPDLKIPVSDMGFQLSDMCYDAVHVWKGAFFRLADHMDRWDRSIAARRYNTLGYDREGMEAVLHECVRRTGLKELMVYIVATRGTPRDGYKDLRTCANRLIAWARPYYSVVTDEECEHGCDIIVSETVRISPDSVDPTVKNFGRLDFVRALFEAYDRDARYALLEDGNGCVTEGRGWNLFMRSGGELLTPRSGVLEGITRQTVLELSAELNVEGKLADVSAERLRDADEIFITSTAGGVMPVRSIDGKPVGDGSPGPLTRRMSDLYWQLHDDPRYSTPVRYGA